MADTTHEASDKEPADTREEWEIQRDEFKSSADAHFRAKSYPAAIADYQSALQLDPTNHILLSNKSAAHLANGEKSKALHDARQCVENAPKDWVKGHTRLAAAMAALGRHSEAIKVYTSVLNDMDPNNEVAKKGLEDCRAKERQVLERTKEENLRVQRELDRQRSRENLDIPSSDNGASVEKKKSTSPPNEEDDLLDDFFSEVEAASDKPKPQTESTTVDQDDSNNRIKIHLSDLGTSSSQIDRLLQTNYEWKNLNPFYVLDIPHTVDDESIISARYRALSLLVHPDKNSEDAIRAKAAFEQVKKAMEQMNDETKRRHLSQLVEQGHKQGKRDWDEELGKNPNAASMSEKEKQDGLSASQNKATMKIFASIEAKRRDVERRKRKYEQRERAQEDEEKEREKKERDHDKSWREVGRVEKRVGNWRDFQKKKG
jgi:DnaJ family protein C protein 8